MGEVDPLVRTLLRGVIIYGSLVLSLGGIFQLYRRETKSGLILLGMGLLLGATLIATAYLRS